MSKLKSIPNYKGYNIINVTFSQSKRINYSQYNYCVLYTDIYSKRTKIMKTQISNIINLRNVREQYLDSGQWMMKVGD